MESYSHEAFTVTGIIISIPSHAEALSIIPNVWKQRFDNKIGETVIGQSYPGMHAIYYNYNTNKTTFDMLIGVMTEEKAIQKNDKLTTIIIPAQNYRYVSIKGGFPDSIWKARDDINHITSDELPRTYSYDLEMYNEVGTECTVAVAVAVS